MLLRVLGGLLTFLVLSSPLVLATDAVTILVPDLVKRVGGQRISLDKTYVEFVGVTANVRPPKKDGFWARLRGAVVSTRSPVIVVTLRIVAGNDKYQAASPILSLNLDKRQPTSDFTVGKRLLPPFRLGPADTVKVTVELRETTVEKSAAMQELLQKAGTAKLVAPATSQLLTFGVSVVDVLTSSVKGSDAMSATTTQEFTQADQVVGTEYIAFVASEDLKMLRELKDKKRWPPSLDSGAPPDRDDLPTFALIKINLLDSILNLDQVLSPTSPVAGLVAPMVNSIKSAKSPDDKCRQCQVLKTFSEEALNLTPADRLKVAIAAMRAGGYDPDTSGRYEDYDCFTFSELEQARKEGLRFGSCQGDLCPVAMKFMQSWLNKTPAQQVVTDKLRWVTHFNNKHEEKSGPAKEFFDEFRVGAYHEYTTENRSSGALSALVTHGTTQSECTIRLSFEQTDALKVQLIEITPVR